MIRIVKSSIPAVLKKHASAWTKELKKAISSGKSSVSVRRRRYNHPEIKRALIAETHGKCAYCESKLLHIAYGDIEHIIAKTNDPSQTYAWKNLTLACDVCNTSKGNTDGVIDPYAVDPEEHFQFLGPMITPKFGSEIAKLTLIILRLNRTPLLERRTEKIVQFVRSLEEILKTPDERVRRVLVRALTVDETAADKEFAACARSFVLNRQREGALPTGPITSPYTTASSR
jgi:uncharacterized protein (TIGR02646 family)